MGENKEYILGTNQTELERLGFQHKVWKRITDSFFDRIKIQKGWKCLDVGAGPGFVSMELIDKVGESGEVTALEPSGLYINYLKVLCAGKNIENIKFIHGNLEDSDIENEHYDMIFLRWVIDFVPKPEKFLLKLLSALKKGGIIAIEDYNYEGIALFPKGGAFDNITETVRNYWRAGGGDPYFISKIPPIFKINNIELLDFSPQSLAGDTDSDIYEWANRFFSVHLQIMADMKVISQKESNEMLADWISHRANPETVFFSPILVDVIGKKL
ncbi:MAG TPA: class I SAM-dependent methyltransferase [Ignavibacteria bacterium]|nr:class I SAM-dependent methyltransferase [Ignavibacteria bacterium]HMR41712.1 class I SAM-dependent methyltransferase [Ignavibacteria bacterium]